MARYTNNNKTLAWMREQGWYPWRVESYNPFSGKKTDLYKIIDYLAITDNETIGVQICGADFAEHVSKMLIDERANTKAWLKNKNRKLVLIGWRKTLKKRGGKQMVYTPRIAWFALTKTGGILISAE